MAEIERWNDEQADEPERRAEHDNALQRPPLSGWSALHAPSQERGVASQKIGGNDRREREKQSQINPGVAIPGSTGATEQQRAYYRREYRKAQPRAEGQVSD